MSLLRDGLLQSYKLATSRSRGRIRAALEQSGQCPAAVLFYHRVADQHPNGWTIGQSDFGRHLDWLGSRCEFATLAEIRESQRAGRRDRLQVCVTFDDGYGENCDWALPQLLNRNIPCVYFVTASNVEQQRPFPHDRECGIELPVNTIEQIRHFANRGIEIGCHTATHPDLGLPLPTSRLRAEIVDSRHRLQDWTGQSIDYFAFPYGQPENISQAAIDVVIEAGFRGFVSAYGGWNWPGEDDFHLQRIHGDPGIARLSNWLTLDPRKLRRGSILQYSRNAIEPADCDQELATV